MMNKTQASTQLFVPDLYPDLYPDSKNGWFCVKRRTANKKQRMKLKELNLWLT